MPRDWRDGDVRLGRRKSLLGAAQRLGGVFSDAECCCRDPESVRHAMTPVVVLLIGIFLLMMAGPLAQRRPPVSPDLVELDVVVLDKQSQPVPGLARQDFQIMDDGRPVEIKTFAAVTSAGS